MAKNDVKQLNYTVDEINSGLQTAFDVGSENKGLTLKYVNNQLQIFNTNGSNTEADWTPVGNYVSVVSANPDANSYKFNFNPLTPTYSVQVKSQIDNKITYDDLAIKYSIQEVDQNNIIQPTNINATWTISKGNNSRVFSEILRFNPDSSEYSFDWVKRIISDEGFYGTGLYNIAARFVGTDNNFRTQVWQVNITDLQLITNFDETKIYSKDLQPKVDISVKGNLNKQVKISLINYSQKGIITEVYKKDFESGTSEIKDNFSLELSTHGVYGLVFECVGTINKTTIESPVIYKELIFIEENNNTPLIRWNYYNQNHLTQYEYENFTYGVYNPENPNSPIDLQLYSENNGKTQNLIITPDNRDYEWMYYAPQPSQTTKGDAFSIKITNTSVENKKFIVVDAFKNAELIQPVGGVAFDFNPVGRTNNDFDKEEYVYNGKNYLTVSEQFDWINGGWKYDNQNRPYFCVKAGHWADLNYKLFGDDTRTSGKNFKIVFKTTNCRKVDAQAIHCYDGKVGVVVKAQNAELFYTGQASSLLNIPYIEDEIIPLEFNIQKDQQMTKPLKSTIQPVEIQPLVTAFLDADPSQTIRFGKTSTGARYNWQQENSSNIRIGSDDCDVWVYRIKAYDTELTNQQILQNYYADSFTGSEGLLKYNDNNILDEDGNIDISLLQTKYPDLHIIQVECDNIWPRGKASSDYQACTVTHLMGNGNLKDNWSVRSRVKLQGTSSLEYISSAGNFDINFRDNIKYKHTDGMYYTKSDLIANQYYTQEQLDEMHIYDDVYSMTDSSIPVDYFNVKVNVASSENANNSQLADWFNLHNPFTRAVKVNGVRDTMEFHPCVIFIKENSDDPKEFPKTDNFHFYACGDFGNSKKNDAVFGMNENDPYDCILEISNNDNPLCLFKTAIFENYQTNTTKDDDGNLIPVTNDVWDGDAVEFRYINDDQEDLLKEKVLRLWKWVYSVDYTQPGIKECFVKCPPVEIGDNVVFELLTNIPYDHSTITSVAPNFLLAYQQENSDGQLEWQTLSKSNIYDYIKLQPELALAINTADVNGYHKITITLPKYATQFSDLANTETGFFINFKNDYVLNDDFSYALTESGDKILDDEKYRLNKFKTEYTQYFEQRSLLFHYLFTERFTMIDNRAKNTFIHTNGNPSEGKEGNVWDYCFNYDDDTALGCNNKGFLTMDYGVEDTDDIYGNILSGDATPAFNAATSVVWKNVRTLKTDLISLFNETTSAWSATSLNNKFEKYQGYKCAQLQMLDMERKYFRPYISGYYGDDSTSLSNYLPMLQGRKTYQRRRFQKYQEIYCESKYKNPEVAPTSDIFTFRSSLPKLSGRSIQPEIIPYIKCYPIIKYDQVDAYTERVWPGQKFKPTGLLEPNDKNFVIYPSKYISELGGLSNVGLETANVSSGAKLLKVDFSNNASLPEADSDSIAFGANNALLEEINISKTLAKSVDLTALTNLKTFNAEDTSITTIEFANGGLIQEAKLGTSLNTLICMNNSNLELLTIQKNSDEKYNLEIVTIDSPSTLINWIDVLDIDNCPNIKEVTILNVNYNKNSCWSFADNSWIEKLYQLNNTTLTGNIYIDAIREPDYHKYLDKWPGLEIQYDTEAGFIPTYIVSYYSDDTKSQLLFTEVYDMDVVAVKPDYIPVKTPDAEYTYEFKQWDIESTSGFYAFNQNTDICAIYIRNPRMYSVQWISDGVVIAEDQFGYGSSVEYPGNESYLQPQQQRSGAWKLFTGWDNSTALITENLIVNALWEFGDYKQYTVNNEGKEFVDDFDTRNLNAAQIYSIVKDNNQRSLFAERVGNNTISCNDRIKIQLGKTLKSYKNRCADGIYQEIISQPTVFSGKENDIIKIDSFMSDIEKPWSLIVDIQFINEYANASMVSCFDENTSSGFRIINRQAIAGNNQRLDTSIIECFGRSIKQSTNQGFVRGKYIIVHPGKEVKNDNGVIVQSKGDLFIYTDDLDQKEPFVSHVRFTGEKWSHNQPLMLGGYMKDGELFGSHGIIHSCELLNIALSESECKELTIWPREEAEFTIVNFGNMYKENGETTSINFLAAQSTLAKVSYAIEGKTTDTPYGFQDSFASEWLNERYFKALPDTWKTILANINVPYSYYSDGQYTIKKELAKIWIPSTKDLNFSEVSYPWSDETKDAMNLMTGSTLHKFITPGCPTFDVYSEAAEGKWVFTQPTDPRAEGREIEQGALWIRGERELFINYYGFWMRMGTVNTNLQNTVTPYYITRSIADDPNSYFKQIALYSTSTTYISTTSSVGSSYLIPCFGI